VKFSESPHDIEVQISSPVRQVRRSPLRATQSLKLIGLFFLLKIGRAEGQRRPMKWMRINVVEDDDGKGDF
jgi:hypothetical protein